MYGAPFWESKGILVRQTHTLAQPPTGLSDVLDNIHSHGPFTWILDLSAASDEPLQHVKGNRTISPAFSVAGSHGGPLG